MAPTLIPYRLTEVVVYGANETCKASRKAAELLGQIAYTTVRYYAGGKEDWINAGFPTEPRS